MLNLNMSREHPKIKYVMTPSDSYDVIRFYIVVGSQLILYVVFVLG
jgi:hypothetical protein